MAQKNETPALILPLFVTMPLLGSGIYRVVGPTKGD